MRAVAASRGERRAPPPLQIGRTPHMGAVGAPTDLARLEQPAVGVVHGAGGGEGTEIRRSLLVALRADALRDRAQNERA